MKPDDDNNMSDAMADMFVSMQRVDENLKKARYSGQLFREQIIPERTSTFKASVAKPGMSPMERWEQRLSDTTRMLNDATTGTESEFIVIGSRLQDYYQKAQKIATSAAIVVQAISDEKITVNIKGLDKLLVEMKEHRQRLESETVLVMEKLESASKSLERAGRACTDSHADFKRGAESLRLRIIVQLSVMKQQYSGLQGKSGSIIEKTGNSIDSLAKKHEQSKGFATGMARKSDGIRSYMAKVVESLQFHDITRQQIEHVKKSMRIFCAGISEANRHMCASQPPADRDTLDFISEVTAYCKLQADQLTYVKKELTHAVGEISSGLKLLAVEAAGISDQTARLTGGAGDEGHSFISKLSQQLSMVGDTLSELSDNSKARRGVMAEAKNISYGALDLSRKLKASSTIGGAGLIVCNHIDSAAKALEECNESGGVKFSCETGRMSADMGLILSSLRTVNGNIIYRLNIVGETGRSLSNDIEATVKGISLHARVSVLVDQINAGLDEIAKEALSMAPYPTRRMTEAVTAKHSFHATLRGMAPAFSGKGASPDNGESFGDNVEIF